MLSRALCAHRLCNSYHRYILVDDYLHLSFSRSFLIALVVTRCLKYSPLCRESFELLPCSFVRMKNLADNSSHLSRIRSSQLFLCFTKILRNAYRSFENPLQPIALEFLACWHYG